MRVPAENKVALRQDALPSADEKVDKILEDDIPTAERAKSRWAALEALVGADPTGFWGR